MTERDMALRWSRRDLLGLAAAVLGLQSPLAKAQTPKVLRVGFIAHYEPFSFTDAQGQVTGFDVEVVRALLQSLGMTMTTEAGSFEKLRTMAKAGQLDLIGNQLLMIPENRVLFDFVRPYASIQLVCVQHEDDERDFLSLDDFVGKRLGVLRDSGIEDQARAALGGRVQGYARIEQALEDLSQKKIDAVLEENLIADYHIERQNLPLKVGAPFTAPQKIGLALVKGQKALQSMLSDGVAELVRQPVFRRTSSQWFGYDVSRPRFSHVAAHAAGVD